MTTWSSGTGTTYYYQLDGQGDVVGLTDSTGQSVASYTYDAWGNILNESGSLDSANPYLYRGYRWDAAVGMYYLNARYYSPETMRFISQDPAGSSVNLYTYADDNPVNEVDPTGDFVEAIALFFIPGIGEVAAVSLAAALTIAAGIYVYERVHHYYYAKGGKQHVRDSGLSNLTDQEISERARDRALPVAERKRYVKEEKARKARNI